MTLTLTEKQLNKLRALMINFMGVSNVIEHSDELIHYNDFIEYKSNNWLYITMVILPKYIGKWYMDSGATTIVTSEIFKHPIDYLYEEYIEKRTNTK